MNAKKKNLIINYKSYVLYYNEVVTPVGYKILFCTDYCNYNGSVVISKVKRKWMLSINFYSGRMINLVMDRKNDWTDKLISILEKAA